MPPTVIVFLLLVLGMVISWLVLEKTAGAAWRIAAGLITMALVSFSVWCVTYIGMVFNYNAYYGSATRDLIESSLAALERDDEETVRKVFRGLRDQYHPTYEHNARYAEQVAEAARHLRGEEPIEPGSSWDGSRFTREMWPGFWEHQGFWIVIDEVGTGLTAARSGDPPVRLENVVLSADCSTLTFQEGDRWRHTLTLRRPDEGTHEWFDLTSNTVSQRSPIYKLVRSRE
jgi:hypothetical protein